MEVFIKIFKGLLVALYVIIIMGSVQNYSATYNGQAVFSTIGIIDNFVVTAILPLILYGVGLLIRKRFFNKDKFSYMSKPEESSDPNPDISESKKPIRVWQIMIPIMLIILVLSVIVNVFFPSSSTPDESQTTSTAPIYDSSWIPSDFSGYPDDDNVAWRWGTRSETNCSYSSGSCWSVMLITRDGCPSGMYAELAIFDGSGVQIDYTNDSTTRVSPNTKVKLTFDTFNEQADTARLSEVSCR